MPRYFNCDNRFTRLGQILGIMGKNVLMGAQNIKAFPFLGEKIFNSDWYLVAGLCTEACNRAVLE